MLQEPIVVLIASNIFISDIDNETECTLSIFTDDTKLGEVVDKPDVCAAIQKDVDKPKKAGKQEHHGKKV